MAFLYGVDPAAYGRMSDLERRWFEAAANRALSIDQERREAMVKAIGASVGNAVAQQLSRIFR